MSPAKRPAIRLQHILTEIDGVADAISNKTSDEVFNDYMLRRVVERALEIVSEAAKALPPELRAQYDAVEWHAIIAIGNRLRHEYYQLSEERLWDIATIHLPALRPVVVAMLAGLPR